MSQETSQWLNTMVLIGYTDKRGTAWHYSESDQGSEPNHYPGPVPIEHVYRRLFNFTVEPVEMLMQVKCDADNLFGISGIDENGNALQLRPIPGRKAWRTSDTYEVLGIFTDGYQGHQYRQWLLESVETILGDNLGIGSAGLLKNRGQAWVSVEVPENVTTPQGVEFRPNLVACTSFDGSLVTTYKRTVTNIVCDNTLRAGLGEAGQDYRVKHTRYSGLRLESARDALAIVETIAVDFTAEVEALCSQYVTEAVWSALMDELVPVPVEEGRGRTMAQNKRAELNLLWSDDERVAPWRNSSFGVLQAYNTWQHHNAISRGASRAERNRGNALTGVTEANDTAVLAALARLA